jgi:hypothetical protein
VVLPVGPDVVCGITGLWHCRLDCFLSAERCRAVPGADL